MSEFFSNLPRLKFGSLGILSQVGRGGPGRLVAIAGVGLLMIGVVVGASLIHRHAAVESTVAKLPPINPLPGGLQSNPAQDALLRRHGREKAQEAEAKHESYTPPIAASKPLKIVDQAPQATEVGFDQLSSPPPPPARVQEAKEALVEAAREVAPVPFPRPAYTPPEEAHIERVAATAPNDDAEYKRAVADLFKQWETTPPRTDVVMTPADLGKAAAPRTQVEETADRIAPGAGEPTPGSRAQRTVLVPAGRGIYAHTVLSVNSDTGGPIVLEADSGPLAGDRMIGTFSKNERDRLIVRIMTVEHRGQPIEVRGLVIAPDSMETAVASSVDEHYLERFVLPAAAAFVSGLGQAVALSNSTTQVSPFGGTITQYGSLNFKQQAAVAGGAAAQQISQTLQQETPKGPTVNLAANVSVGVMFLSDVLAPAPSGAVYK